MTTFLYPVLLLHSTEGEVLSIDSTFKERLKTDSNLVKTVESFQKNIDHKTKSFINNYYKSLATDNFHMGFQLKFELAVDDEGNEYKNIVILANMRFEKNGAVYVGNGVFMIDITPARIMFELAHGL